MVEVMSASQASAGSAPRILVVDDDDDAREVIRDVLESAGFAVSEARNGKHALDSLLGHPETALVLLDLDMPVMSGTELLAHMKSDERLSSVPVLILSGVVSSKAPEGQPVVGFMSKPCDMKGLIQAVTAHVNRRDGVLAAAPRP
jgi:CheY-like chemotaxis protein